MADAASAAGQEALQSPIDKPLDMDQVRRAIEAAPAEGRAVVVHRSWLERAEREILEGRAAKAQLAAERGVATVIAAIASGARP